MTASYNDPNAREREASFHSYAEAAAYAEEYGGAVEPRGVAFVVGADADHKRAQDDLAALQAAVSAPAPSVASDVDAAVARAVANESARLRAEFEAERAAFVAAQSAPETVDPNASNA